MNKTNHFCYLPTKKLCELSDKLDANFFPDNPDDVIRQVLTTYLKHPSGLKTVTFTRIFDRNGKHYDSTVSEVFVTKSGE
tara:strand:+ start:5652 stop:5891 length:240 start_codon:yes stop_codon:yes gene_type:complete